jgi:hypothetical protein
MSLNVESHLLKSHIGNTNLYVDWYFLSPFRRSYVAVFTILNEQYNLLNRIKF